ncbi:Gfo/Idh/MocA family protein [Piscibacillus halophilus]|uniref:Predicted dehydrogenase n=1 Tax=Piscibacillus halophilus TaxID=571933 RepID=A0A1H9HPV1_9BACI|nr:Gfo/Idh/MocA family oxidoreductase [Piscibacillus halophilus]SEQ64262.1 Predicted dehydrogenase [Piscibacillus halophilus]
MIRIGTIGTSQISSKLIEASRHVAGVSVNAVYSRDENRALEFAESNRITKSFSNLDHLLQDEDINCIYIASPNALHYEHVMKSLRHNKHVICEKPLFYKVEHFEEAYQLADEKGLFLFEAMRHLHSPNFFQLKEKVELIGHPSSVYLQRMRYSSKYDDYLNGKIPNVFSKEMGGGALLDLGVYPISLAVGLFGEPKEVQYFPVLLDNHVDGSGTLVMNYNNFNCVIMCSKTGTSYNHSEFVGEKGTMIIDQVAPISKIEFISQQEQIQLALNEDRPNMSYELEQFVHMIESRHEQSYYYYRDISYKTIKIVEQCLKHQSNV